MLLVSAEDGVTAKSAVTPLRLISAKDAQTQNAAGSSGAFDFSEGCGDAECGGSLRSVYLDFAGLCGAAIPLGITISGKPSTTRSSMSSNVTFSCFTDSYTLSRLV
jgi:hypothetical protein